MPDPNQPNETVARTAGVSAAKSAVSSADETAPTGAGKPAFGPPSTAGEVGTLGPYRVVKELGKGGMGAVYLAVDTRLDRTLALKVMLPAYAADADAKGRFLREARAAAKVTHDNVVTVYEADERDGVPYIAMQFLKGYPLDEYLKTKGLPPLAHVVRIVREAALGLAAAHELGLVHRDVKPGNLWLEAPNGRVKVLDFGLAKPVGAETELTSTGAVVGTPAYMSPEQARGVKVDARTDLFSLGVVLYRLCTGKTPFAGPNVMAVLMALGSDDPTPVRELNPNVPEPLAELIHQLLAKKPEHRPQTAAAVAQRLREVLAEVLNPGASASASQPVVVLPAAVPLSVTAQPESAFANLTDEDEADGDETQAESLVAPPKKGGKGVLIAAGVAALLAVGVVAVVASQVGKKEPPAVAEKPPEPSPVASPKPTPKVTPTSTPSADPDRAAAEWVVSSGSIVRVNGTDRDIETTDALPAQAFVLTSVNFNGTHRRALTDADMERFRRCANLTSLVLSDAPLTDAGLSCFAGCKELRYVDLDRLRITDAGFGHLRGCLELRRVDLSGTGVTDAALAYCKDFKELYELKLDGTAVTDAGLEHLSKLFKLTTLSVNNTKVTAAGVQTFARAQPQCKVVWGEPKAVKGDDRRAAAHVLAIGGKVVVKDAAGSRQLKPGDPLPDGPFAVTTVEYFKIDALTDADFAPLAGLTELSGITAYSAKKVTDAALAHLADAPALTSLVVPHTGVTGTGVAHTPRLKSLHMYGTPVSPAGVKQIGRLTGLVQLNLTDTPLADADLAHLKPLTALVGFDLDRTAVTDAGLEHLLTIGGDHGYFRLNRTKVTAAGVAKLKAARPKHTIFSAFGPFREIDEPSLKRLQAMPPDAQVRAVSDELKNRNFGFDAPLKVNAGPVRSVQVESAVLEDLTPLRIFAGLEDLYVGVQPSQRAEMQLADLSPLAGLPLRNVCVVNCPRVADITPLRGMPLTQLHLVGTRVTSLEPVRDAPLTAVSLVRTPVQSLAPLAGKKLQEFVAHDLRSPEGTAGTLDLDYRILKGMPVRKLGVEPRACSADEWAVLRDLPVEKLYVGLSYDPARDADELAQFLKAVPTVSAFDSELLKAPAEGLSRKALADVVRRFPNVKTVNDKPAAEFWKQFDAKK